VEDNWERLMVAAVVKWVQTTIEDCKAFRSYLENRLREKLKRIEDPLAELGCSRF